MQYYLIATSAPEKDVMNLIEITPPEDWGSDCIKLYLEVLVNRGFYLEVRKIFEKFPKEIWANSLPKILLSMNQLMQSHSIKPEAAQLTLRELLSHYPQQTEALGLKYLAHEIGPLSDEFSAEIFTKSPQLLLPPYLTEEVIMSSFRKSLLHSPTDTVGLEFFLSHSKNPALIVETIILNEEHPLLYLLSQYSSILPSPSITKLLNKLERVCPDTLLKKLRYQKGPRNRELLPFVLEHKSAPVLKFIIQNSPTSDLQMSYRVGKDFDPLIKFTHIWKDMDLANTLLKRLPFKDATGATWGYFFLHHDSVLAQPELVQGYIDQFGREAIENTRDLSGRTPSEMARIYGFDEVAELLGSTHYLVINAKIRNPKTDEEFENYLNALTPALEHLKSKRTPEKFKKISPALRKEVMTEVESITKKDPHKADQLDAVLAQFEI